MTTKKLEEILPALQTYFEVSEHKERPIPGGKKWFYVPHQCITERLNKVCPGDWHTRVVHPQAMGDYSCVYVELTICGVTRTGVGDDKMLADDRKMVGTPAVRAFRSAFKDAAEQFGIAAYLDAQKGNDRQKFLNYMLSGDKISPEQCKELWAIGRKNNMSNEDMRALFQELGIKSTESISVSQYNVVLDAIDRWHKSKR
jgi:hypothetical protein